MTIHEIFTQKGEAYFREVESRILKNTIENRRVVIATGGGIILREQNRERMKASGYVCYLTASIEQLVERTARDKKRPLLQVENPRQKIIDLVALRDPLYREAADFIINTDRRSPKVVAQEISALIDAS
ncbi:MAG: shikimate kinase [Moraxellaceae bacterium]|nr:MAG: shikimate kinase [Moraxellaceae bacterium]